MDQNWHIWVIKPHKFEHIERYLTNEVKEIKEILYPMITKESRSKSGKILKKKVPLYASYLFLCYNESPEVHYKIKRCSFIGRYVGKCYGENLNEVVNMKNVEKWNTVNKKVSVNDYVSINGGPLKGFKGEVVGTSGNKVFVYVDIFGRSVQTEVDFNDVDIVKKAS